MKSFCIKTNQKEILHDLLEIENTYSLDELYLSHRYFCHYENIILHYKGENLNAFYDVICQAVTNIILHFYEERFLRHILDFNYFYFTTPEKKEIMKQCHLFLQDDQNLENIVRKEHIFLSTLHYVEEHKAMILDGFATFRLKNYIKILDYIVDTSVNHFLIEKEYNDFVELLRMYIQSKSKEESKQKVVHLIYHNGDSLLLDEEKNRIPMDYISNIKYLSDITFSSNDYALNTLLTLLPQKIIIHEIDTEDEFITTLKLIFDSRVHICKCCPICQSYQLTCHKNRSRTEQSEN